MHVSFNFIPFANRKLRVYCVLWEAQPKHLYLSKNGNALDRNYKYFLRLQSVQNCSQSFIDHYSGLALTKQL